MELVYLWIEEYKNIKKQGFNFSPRFRCEFKAQYDENGELKEDSELIIEEKKDYVNIFPENINVTAIVGENGSGKSTLFEILSLDIKHLDKNILIVSYNSETKEYEYFSNGIHLYNYKETIKDSIVYFSNVLSGFQTKISKDIVFDSSCLSRFESDLASLYRELTKDDYFNYFETVTGILTLNLEEILLKEPNTFEKLDKQILFTDKKFSLDFSLIDKSIDEDKFYKKILSNDNNDTNSRFLKYILLSRLKSSFLLGKKAEKILKKNRRILEKKDFNIEDYNSIHNKLDDLSEITEYSTENIKKTLDTFEHKEDSIWISKDFYKIQQNHELNFLSSWRVFFYLKRHFYKDSNESRDYLSLSSGEKEYLKLLISFIYNINFKTNKNIYLFDEVDLSLHPNWQKRLINDLMYYIEYFSIDKPLHLIFATHSPFLLSDMNSHNVLYIKKGIEQKNININSFGANIHTLLSHSFFMKDGLMGEFAKSKIDEVLEKLNSSNHLKKEDIEFCETIINIIGEPIIKGQLQKMLDSKRLQKIDRIDDIEKQIQRLSKELERLRNDKN